MSYIRPLKEVSYKDIAKVGGKAASLGEMLAAGINVPDGFVVTTDAYQQSQGTLSTELENELLNAFDRLGVSRVAVRSSAVAEDGTEASWAGQLETVLNVTREGVAGAVQFCWDSMQSERAQSYAKEHKVSKSEQSVGVVVQAMVNSSVAGVMFTANPVNSQRSELMIEAIYGLGELLVQGIATPESLIINKATGETTYRSTHRQQKKLVYDAGQNTERPIEKKYVDQPILSEDQIKELIAAGDRIEKYYGSPQDIEWAIEDDKLYIVQSRPITTLMESTTGLPEFIDHCTKTIARPATLQRDELFRYTSNAIHPVEVATIPLEGTTRAYYLESESARQLMGKCIQSTNTREKLSKHLSDYEVLKQKAKAVSKNIGADPRNYQKAFKSYFEFLDHLSPFLYVGVAVDKILYPKLKAAVEEQYPEAAERILEIVATPKDHHDYQKQRLAICELVPRYLKDPKNCATRIEEIVKNYQHVNEYSFVEKLVTSDDIKQELSHFSLKEAEAELHDIRSAVEQDSNHIHSLQKLLPDEQLLVQALLIKEYSLLRTDRIDRLKLVQVALRAVFEELAKDFSAEDGKKWTRAHVANLLYDEINRYFDNEEVPSFELATERLTQQYFYCFTNNQATVVTDKKLIENAQAVLIKPEEAREGSLISPGTTAFRGVAIGKVVKITGLSDLKKVKPGVIMVARVTMPDYTAVMKQALGFITAEGGITSHAAIVARELGKPCIVGSDNCMEVLKDGDLVSLDSANQIVTYANKAEIEPTEEDELYLGKPDTLFYWGPADTKPFLMADFMAAEEVSFAHLYEDKALPNPPQALVLFHDHKMVWLSKQIEFDNFVKRVFESYAKQDTFEKDQSDWRVAVEDLDQFMDITQTGKITSKKELAEITKVFIDKVSAVWHPTLIAEFALYGAEFALNDMLSSLSRSDRQAVLGAFTVPEQGTFLSRIDAELFVSKDPKALAEKYPWIQDGYHGVSESPESYFTQRLEEYGEKLAVEYKTDHKTEQQKLAKKLNLSKPDVAALNLARKLAVFMDDRKAWMMRTRRYLDWLAMQIASTHGLSIAQVYSLSFAQLLELDSGTVTFEQSSGWGYKDGKTYMLMAEQARDYWYQYLDHDVPEQSLQGMVASDGGRHFVRGLVRVVTSPKDDVEDQKIMVVPFTSPDYVPLMRKAKALITDHGGMMSHAAIVARELGIPCIVGTKRATKLLKDGDNVVLDLVKGEVVR